MKLIFLFLMFTEAKYDLNKVRHDSSPVDHHHHQQLEKVFQQIGNRELIFHFDNATLRVMHGTFLQQFQMLTLINIDRHQKKILNQRHAALHLVYLKSPLMFELSLKSLQDNDVVIVLASSNQTQCFQELQMVEIFIYDLQNSTLFHCCCYCGNETGKLKKISLNELRFRNNFRNFYGHEFQIAVPFYPPFFECFFQNGKCIGRGSEMQVLQTLAQVLNFRYNFIKYNTTHNISEWQAMIFAVNKQEVDWAIGGISISIDRTAMINFTRVIKHEGYTVLFTTHSNIWDEMQNFSFILKGSFFVVFTVLSLLLTALAGKLFESLLNRNRQSFSRTVKKVLKALIDQPSLNLGKTWSVSTKILFMFWLSFSLIFTTYYRSRLAALLTRPKIKDAETISELLDKGYKFQVNKLHSSVLQENFKKTTDKIYRKMYENMKNDLSFCDSIRLALNAKVGVIDEETALQYEVHKSCRLSFNENLKLRLIRENLFGNSYHAWCLQIGAPFRKKFSSIISRMDASGLILHWYKDNKSFKIFRSNERNTVHEFKPFSLRKMWPAFTVQILGLSGAAIIFIWEKIKAKLIRMKRKVCCRK